VVIFYISVISLIDLLINGWKEQLLNEKGQNVELDVQFAPNKVKCDPTTFTLYNTRIEHGILESALPWL
jgi:hypothetical protein